VATSKLSVPSFPITPDHSSNSVYSGELIKSLIEIVEQAEEKYPTPTDQDDDEQTEHQHGSAPLTIDDVLARSGCFENQNPYLRLLERVLA
jgi:hypothetical protein